MAAAYRQGVLEPDYPYGMSSQIREHTMLQLIAMEQDADALETSKTLLNTLMAPHVDPKYIRTMVTELSHTVQHILTRREYDPQQLLTQEQRAALELKQTSNMLQHWKDSGFEADMIQRMKERYSEDYNGESN